MRKLLLICTIGIMILLLGCSSGKSPLNKPEPPQMANPASTFCIESGGNLSIIDEKAGQRGICTLKDGTVCDEWQYYRGECPTGQRCATNCPLYTPPSPDFCKNGTMINGGVDDCNCTLPPKCELNNATAKKHYCSPEQKKAQVCTQEYTPTCGWYGANIKCIRYPCAITSSNPCMACATENVEYWTSGECPTK